MSLDAEKAFDLVNWKCLYGVPEEYGFHQTFITTIKSLYNSPTARVKVNGGISNYFSLEKETRQGCPISPSLFALFIEALSFGIRQDKNITGIKMQGQEHKMSLLADDR